MPEPYSKSTAVEANSQRAASLSKRLIPIMVLSLFAATAAHAQYGGGGMGGGGMGGGGMGGGGGGMGGGGGHGGHGGRSRPQSDPTATPAPAATPEKPVSSIQIVGVIKAIDPGADRVTIAYEDVQALNWPAGTMPFQVSKTALLKGATVGEKVRFTLESQQIASLTPY
jgi:Cu/Ag efflux protein CusF